MPAPWPVRGRRQIGIGTLLTLFVVRAMYMFAGGTHTRDVTGKAPGADDLDEHRQIIRIGARLFIQE